MTTTPTLELCGKCGNEFDTLEAVFSHDCTGRRFTTVPNGFGGTTTRPRAAGRPQGQPPTDKQIGFLRSLLAERQGVEAAEAVRATLNGQREAGELTRKAVSSAIDTLLKIRKPAPAQGPSEGRTAAPANDLPEVDEGRYAIRVDGVVKFYRVDRPTEGRWAGFTFVKVQASDDLYPIRGAARRPILETIAADPQAASVLYGHELGECGVCGRTLTDEDSRARGIGPVCAAKKGW